MSEFAVAAQRLSGLAGAMLGWRPDEFWAATPAELATIVQGFSDEAPGGVPAAPSDLAALMEQFPDG